MSHPSNRFSRRQLLALTGVGLSGFAGCSSSDDVTTPTDSGTEDGVRVEGQDLILPTQQHPDEIHLVPDWGPISEALHTAPMTPIRGTDFVAPVDLRPALYDTGMWSRAISHMFSLHPGELYPALFSEFDLTPQKMTVRIQEDAGWSDGEPVTAFDLAAPFSIPQPSAYNSNSNNPTIAAANPEAASSLPVQDVTMPDGRDGKVVEYHNWDWDEYPAWEAVNGFEYLNFSSIYSELLGPMRRHGQVYPMHVDPWGSIIEERWEWRQDHKIASGDPRDPLTWGQWVGERATPEDVYDTRTPGNFPQCGAWTVEELRNGADVIALSPNEHHYAADRINFERVKFQWYPEDDQLRSALDAGDLDYASVPSSPETAQSYPDKYTSIPSPHWRGHVINVDHSSRYGDRRVRQALLYALDKQDVADAVNPLTTEPVRIPGGDSWLVDVIASQGWIDDTLIDYSQDVSKAEDLMEQAGYQRQDGTWTKDGEALQARIATGTTEPTFEPAVEAQWNDFGVDAEVRTFEADTFAERWAGARETEDGQKIENRDDAVGEFDLWTDARGRVLAGDYSQQAYYWYESTNRSDRIRAHAIYDHDDIETAIASEEQDGLDGGYSSSGYSYTCAPGCQAELTVSVPPIGEPDGSPEPWGPTYVQNATTFLEKAPEDPFTDYEYYHPPHDEPHPENAEYFWKKFLWTNNWLLPSLPLVLTQEQHYLNTKNWVWPTDHPMWEYFGMDWGGPLLAGMGQVAADTEDPKGGAFVNGR